MGCLALWAAGKYGGRAVPGLPHEEEPLYCLHPEPGHRDFSLILFFVYHSRYMGQGFFLFELPRCDLHGSLPPVSLLLP